MSQHAACGACVCTLTRVHTSWGGVLTQATWRGAVSGRPRSPRLSPQAASPHYLCFSSAHSPPEGHGAQAQAARPGAVPWEGSGGAACGRGLCAGRTGTSYPETLCGRDGASTRRGLCDRALSSQQPGWACSPPPTRPCRGRPAGGAVHGTTGPG